MDRQNKRNIELLFDLARIGVRKAKADMELGLARDQKDKQERILHVHEYQKED